MAITHESLNEFSRYVLDTLSLVLIDDLGSYLIGDQEIPAVWVTPPDLPQAYSIVPDSGIEAILGLEPSITASRLLGRMSQTLRFELLLRQWDETKSILPATQKIMSSKKFLIHDDPIIRPLTEIKGEKFYAQARIYLTVTDTVPYV